MSTRALIKSILPPFLPTLLVIVLVFVRFIFLYDYKSFWIDEQASINAACGDSTLNAYSFEALQQIRDYNSQQTEFAEKIFHANIKHDRSNALLFDYTLSAWTGLFGVNLFSIRALSLFFFTFSLYLCWLIGRRFLKKQSMFLVLLLSSSLLFRYNMEGRTYMMTLFLSLFSTYLFLNYIETKSKQLLACYYVLVLLCFYSHYLSVVVFVWHFVLAITEAKKSEKFRIVLVFAILALLVLITLLLLNARSDLFARLASANENISKNAVTSIHSRPFNLSNLLTGTIQVMSQMTGLSLQSVLQIRFFAVLLLLPLFLIADSLRRKGWAIQLPFLLLAATHLIYLSLICLLSGNTTIFQLCYSIFVLPYYLLWMAKLAEEKSSRFAFFLLWLIVLVSLSDSIGYVLLA